MPAQSEEFPWPSYYGNFDFFEERMREHGKVASLTAQGPGAYILTKTDGSRLRVFICECYSFGLAEYYETIRNIGSVDAVIINSTWCSYTMDAKRYCRSSGVGVFHIGNFMSALHKNDTMKFLTPGEIKYYEKQGWSTL